MTGGKRHHSIAGVFVFLLLGLFALMSMLLVLEGARAYRAAVDLTSRHNTERVMHAYIRNAVRAEDTVGAVTLEEVDGVPVIRIRQEMEMRDEDDTPFSNYIYCYEGMLMSQYLEDDHPLHLEQGEDICQVAACEMSLEDNMLHVVLTDENGKIYQDEIALRCAEAEVDAI